MLKKISTGFLATLVLSLTLLIAPTVLAKELEDRKWIEVRTANFQIRSRMNEKKSIELAYKLEMFRVVASLVTNTKPIESSIPTEILALGSASITKSFGVQGSVAGLFMPRLRKNTVLVRDTAGMEETTIILHEYVHFLLNSHSGLNYPKWYNEGFAEYLSATIIENGNIVLGAVATDRAKTFTYDIVWIPMSWILAPDKQSEWGPMQGAMFYAEAWALVHYLQHRKDGPKPFGQEMAEYLQLVDSGMGSVDAFEKAFAITPRQLDNKIQHYLNQASIPGIQFSAEGLLTDFNPEVRVLPREEIALILGNTALYLGGFKNAQRWFEVAATDARYQARAEAGLGDVLKFNDEFDAAEPHFERAVALAPDDPYCLLDMAEYWHDRAAKSEDKDLQTTYLAQAREYYIRAWNIDDAMPETYAMYGETFLLEGEDFAKAVQMLEQAELLLPSSTRVRVALAEAYLGTGRTEDAASAAQSVLAWSHGDESIETRAQKVLDRIAKN